MSSRPHKLRLIALLALGALATSLAVVLPAQAKPGSCGRPSGCTAFELQHAGSTFGWYPVVSRHEFKGGVPSSWKKKGRGGYGTNNGMLELYANKDARLSTTWTLSKATGRWETRFRTDRMRSATRKGLDYTIRIQLIPTKKSAQHCGAQGVTMLNYRRAKPHTAAFEIHTLPNNVFKKVIGHKRNIGHDEWHTIAVEITRKRISWYVDAKVVAKEVRPAALLNVPMKMKFSLIPPKKNVHMRDAKIQIDWGRYWNLKKKGKNQSKVAKAPRTKRHTAKHVC
ncbi:hypothetical protein ABIE44_001059 [Marmoricola sp. OAE513]|uniref:hypothetical protein n=1 Tax=Marmoricola sp. OAE513 TaxID=2817894 RepID=UPI001AE23A0D